jgi:hypothetical protein
LFEFFEGKSDLKGNFLTMIIDFNIAGLDVKFILSNDLGENKALYD